MIILDTNVVSELQGRLHTAHLLRWLNAQDREAVFLPTIVIAEIRYGLELLADGRRKRQLFAESEAILALFKGRIVGFPVEAAYSYGKLMAQRKNIGRTMEIKDAMIAAICLSSGAALATRNTKDFAGLDLPLINPFEEF